MTEESDAAKVVSAAFLGAGLGAPRRITFEEKTNASGRINTLITAQLADTSPNAKQLNADDIGKMVVVAASAILHESALDTKIVGPVTGTSIQLDFNGTTEELSEAGPKDVLKEALRLTREGRGHGDRGAGGIV